MNDLMKEYSHNKLPKIKQNIYAHEAHKKAFILYFVKYKIKEREKLICVWIN